jgi:hypothetical protein
MGENVLLRGTKESQFTRERGNLKMLGAGLEPASLSAYAPQTYVSASSTTRAFESEKLSPEGSNWQVSFHFLLQNEILPIAIKF